MDYYKLNCFGDPLQDALFVDDDGFALLQFSPDVAATTSSPAPYTAPEQLSLREDPVPAIASDIYSFGSIIHWVSTISSLRVSLFIQRARCVQDRNPATLIHWLL